MGYEVRIFTPLLPLKRGEDLFSKSKGRYSQPEISERTA